MAAFRGMHVVLRKIAMRDYQESVTTGQTHRQTDAGQSDPYVPLCFAGNTKTTTSFGGNFRILKKLPGVSGVANKLESF